MEVIVNELQRNDIDIDKRTLSHHINEILDRHGELYGEIAARVNSEDLSVVFTEMNVNNCGRVMAYLTLIYLLDIPEDARREAVRLVATIMKDMDITRVVFPKTVFKNSPSICLAIRRREKLIIYE